jgi:hypothetical protein
MSRLSRSEKKLYQQEMLEWYGMMVGAGAAMPEDEKLALQEWERTHKDGLTPTSDWPGWEKYIGKKPVPPPQPDPFRKQLIPVPLRWQVWERDNFTCVHCGTRRNLSIDHIKPESVGGTLEIANLQTLCRPCNSRKGNRF